MRDADEKNPFEAIQALMLDNLEKMQGATQSYIDMFGKAMQALPGANQDAIAISKHTLSGKLQQTVTSSKSSCVQGNSRKLSASKSNTFSLN
jgi:hypothetical protein